MRLVNCPICGTRCSADIEKCPECGFEIRKYFESENVSSIRKKQPPIMAACALGAILILVFMFLSFSTSGIDVSGVYSGDDNEILVLNSDGLAYYYCFDIQYTELECPWYIKDGTVYIELSRLHCTIFANIDKKELIFKSNSINWNTEVFTRLNVKPEQYLTKIPSTNDPKATLNRDGTISYTNDDITYILPKMFMDMEDDFDSKDDTSIFIDQDVQSDYIASATFHSSKGNDLTQPLAETLAHIFASGFYENTTISNCTVIEIAGHTGYRFELTGFLNKGFKPLEGHEMDGYIIIFYNESTGNNNYLMLVQTSNRDIDDTAVFEEILQSAR